MKKGIWNQTNVIRSLAQIRLLSPDVGSPARAYLLSSLAGWMKRNNPQAKHLAQNLVISRCSINAHHCPSSLLHADPLTMPHLVHAIATSALRCFLSAGWASSFKSDVALVLPPAPS